MKSKKNWHWRIRKRPCRIDFARTSEIAEWGRLLGVSAADLDPLEAAYRIGVLYTALMPQEYKKRFGAHYTPPALCDELLDMATENGVDWSRARVLDPACGGGAFLTPVAQRMVAEVESKCELEVLEDIERRLEGYELDPFARWLTAVFLDVVLGDLCIGAGRRHRCRLRLCNSLEKVRVREGFDLVIGNPPYGRVQLPHRLRVKFARGLFGHANLYGLFTDQALKLTRKRGLIAYVTPTSLLSGEYFKSLRGLLADEAPPVSLGFVTERKGVFDDVLQETLLAVYQQRERESAGSVRLVSPKKDGTIETSSAGRFTLPEDPEDPWMIPRTKKHGVLLRQIRAVPCRLSDIGYTVSTGPFVWNRHKLNLRNHKSKGSFPVVWAESVRSGGRFEFRSSQRNHKPFFEPQPEEQWVVTDFNCVLVHRTTAIEQDRRLIAAELPYAFIEEHGAVVIENHLNMVKPVVKAPAISPTTLAAILNSTVIDQLFRCINGSVAVSAFELKALPLPSVHDMEHIERLVFGGIEKERLEQALMHAFSV
ncbi:MAG: Eco57I restriction-modification methylase domain-containing protein [Gammaproteobacteria bacterium]|nr:Eco57I restriction-modification methylase domain-containing protein [Gammaproteobacteria bacterium]